ncbi:hypothetical protein Tco_0161957 [Tanacetum coccineum]
MWEVLKRKFEKSLTSNTSCRDDDIHSHHDDHQEDDAPPKGEKRVKRHKASKSSKSAKGSSSKHSTKDFTTYVSKQQQQQQEWDAWVEETVIDEYEVISKDETPELITELQDVDKRVPTIFDYDIYLKDIVKFYDATLEKVLKEVKLKIFQSEPWRKPHLIGELDRDILRAFEREITKRLSH